MVQEGLSEEVICELRPERQGRDAAQRTRPNGKCKGPGVEQTGPGAKGGRSVGQTRPGEQPHTRFHCSGAPRAGQLLELCQNASQRKERVGEQNREEEEE